MNCEEGSYSFIIQKFSPFPFLRFQFRIANAQDWIFKDSSPLGNRNPIVVLCLTLQCESRT